MIQAVVGQKMSKEPLAPHKHQVDVRRVFPGPNAKSCQVIRSAAPVTQNHLSKPEDLRLQNATPLRKSAPGPPNSSDEHVSCTAPARENAALQILFKCPTPAIFFGHNPLLLPRETTSERPKVARTCGALYILTSKCASRHNGVRFLDISTSKSPNVRCF